jgi:hypothetical protein
VSQAVLDRAPQAPADVLTGGESEPDVDGAAARRRWRNLLWALLAPVGVVALIAAIVIPQLHHGGLRPGEAELDANGGRATVQHGDGGSIEEVTGSARVRSGDIVTAQYGEPSLRLPGGGELRLRSADASGDATAVKVAASPELRNGDLLATSERHAFDLVADGTVVTVTADGGGSVVRLSRTNSTVDVGVYRGRAAIDSAGVRDTVPALRQVAVTGLRNVDQAFAVPVDTSDVWDRQYLAPAIDAQHLVDPLRTSFDGLVANASLTAAQLARALPGLLPEGVLSERLASLPQGLDPGGVLVGATIASLGTRGTPASRWDAAFSFHDDGGATWGLVAMDQGVTAAALNQALQDAVQRLLEQNSPALAAVPPAAGAVAPAATTPSPPPPPAGTGTGTGGAPAPGGGSPAPTVAPEAPTVTTAPPLISAPNPIITLPPLPPLTGTSGGGDGGGDGGVLQPLLNTVGGLLNGLLG